MRKIKTFTFLLILFQSAMMYSQGTGFIPPSPQSFSFVKTTNVVSENEHTGSASVSIPLFTYKSNKLSTDISLIYSGAGVKVDDLPNDAGMTWVVNAGGVITRTVNGLIDEKTTMRMHKPEAELLQKTASDCAADEEIRTACYTPQQMDTERDIFDFRFGDLSGSFYLDENFIPVFLKNDSDVRIKNILPANETDNRKFIGFELTTKEGIQYIFGGSVAYWETTASKAMPANPPGDYAITSFFLKEIQYLNGEKIFFSYEDTPLVTNSISKIHTRYLYSAGLGTGIMPNLDPELIVLTQTHYTKNKKRILSISNSENPDVLNFIYSERTDSDFKKYLSGIEYKVNNSVFKKIAFDYLFENSNPPQNIQRFYLTQLNYYNNNIFEKKYQFNYDNPLDLPARLTYGQDMYGYFNGHSENGSLIAAFFGDATPSAAYLPSILSTFGNRRPDFAFASKGTLKEVIYPTGGKTKFEYEAPKTKALFKTKMNMGEDFSSGGTSTQLIENLHFDQNIQFTLTTYSGDASPNHMKLANFTVKDLDSNIQIYANGKSYGYAPQDSITGSFSVQKNKRYLLSFTPRGNAELKYSYSHKDPIDDFGIRLKSVTHSENNQVSEYKRLYYCPAALYTVKAEDINENEMMIVPYVKYATFDEFHENMNMAVTYSAHNSTNSSPLYNSRLQERYRVVTTSLGGDHFENGGYQKTFRKDSDDALVRIQPSSGSGYGAGAPSSGTGYGGLGSIQALPNFFGTLLNDVYFPAKGNRLSFSGTLQNTKYFVKKNGSIYKNKQVQNQYRYNILKTNPNLFVSKVFNDLTDANCPTGNVQRIANFYITMYKNYTVDTKIEKETVTDYIDEVPLTLYNNLDDYWAAENLSSESAYRKLITTTNYEYSSMPNHHQLTKQTITTPENSITETNYKYAHEKNNQLMISKNMIGIPLETTVTQTVGGVTKTLGKTETVCPASLPTPQAGNLVLPLSQKSYDKLNSTSSTDVTYDKYDEKGNILQYTTKDGIPVAIVWGYHKTQPIAKVEGITYDQLTSSVPVSGIVTASDNDAADPSQENLLLDTLNSFRKQSALSGKLISTYTYDPLIGVTSITPPSGVRQTYTYDSANRLKETGVRGKNSAGSYINKKVSENKYNYKP